MRAPGTLTWSNDVAVVMDPSAIPDLGDRARRLRIYRLLVNSFTPLLAIALLVVVLRWTVPPLLSLLVFVWTADAFLLAALAVPWLLVSWAFAFGKIKCPSCEGPFTSGFHLWVPKACQHCGYDITARGKRRDS